MTVTLLWRKRGRLPAVAAARGAGARRSARRHHAENSEKSRADRRSAAAGRLPAL